MSVMLQVSWALLAGVCMCGGGGGGGGIHVVGRLYNVNNLPPLIQFVTIRSVSGHSSYAPGQYC